MNPLTAKTPYYGDRTFRSKELTPQIGFASRESAVAYLNDVLDGYRIQASYTPEQIQQLLHLLTEISLETVRQTGDSTDYRGIGEFMLAVQKALSDQQAAVYNGEVIQAWEAVRQHYKVTGKTAIDLGEYTAQPVLLSVQDKKVVLNWSLEPTDRAGVVRCYDTEDEAYAKKTWKEINTNPNSRISVGHLHAFFWNTEIYAKNTEPVYRSFKRFVEERLEAFRVEHGALTPTIDFKVSDVITQTYGGSAFLAGWRITVKSLMEHNREQPTKQGVLDRLLSHLPSIN